MLLDETSDAVAYAGRGRGACGEVEVEVEVDVADGGVLVWDAPPFVVSTGADVRRSTSARLGRGAAPVVLRLEQPGAVARRLGGQVHRVVLTEVAAAWGDLARDGAR